MIRTFLTVSVVAALTASTLLTTAAESRDPRGPHSQYRHDIFELVKYSGLSILNGLQGKVPTPDAHYAHHADILNQAAEMARDALKVDTRDEKGYTEAKAAIWDNAEDFAAKMDKFVADTAALKAAAASGDKGAIAGATQAVFKNCKGCHDVYREED